jgi:hypothetical protein
MSAEKRRINNEPNVRPIVNMVNVEQSRLYLAHKNSMSLKTTIPIFVSKVLELETGQSLEWKTKVVNGEMVAIVKKSGSGSKIK